MRSTFIYSFVKTGGRHTDTAFFRVTAYKKYIHKKYKYIHKKYNRVMTLYKKFVYKRYTHKRYTRVLTLYEKVLPYTRKCSSLFPRVRNITSTYIRIVLGY
jgi:hypothetical protein